MGICAHKFLLSAIRKIKQSSAAAGYPPTATGGCFHVLKLIGGVLEGLNHVDSPKYPNSENLHLRCVIFILRSQIFELA